jgi:hypothetical protein
MEKGCASECNQAMLEMNDTYGDCIPIVLELARQPGALALMEVSLLSMMATCADLSSQLGAVEQCLAALALRTSDAAYCSFGILEALNGSAYAFDRLCSSRCQSGINHVVSRCSDTSAMNPARVSASALAMTQLVPRIAALQPELCRRVDGKFCAIKLREVLQVLSGSTCRAGSVQICDFSCMDTLVKAAAISGPCWTSNARSIQALALDSRTLPASNHSVVFALATYCSRELGAEAPLNGATYIAKAARIRSLGWPLLICWGLLTFWTVLVRSLDLAVFCYPLVDGASATQAPAVWSDASEPQTCCVSGKRERRLGK